MESLPIRSLILRRSDELRLSHKKIIIACGYKNLAKGLRRFQELLKGNVDSAQCILEKLPTILKVEQSVIEQALKDTFDRLREKAESEYRESFRPHAVVVCERNRPEPLFVAAVIGVDRILRIDFAADSPPITYLRQALDGVRDKLERWGSVALPAFGRPRFVAINYAIEKAVVFTLSGDPVQILDRAGQVGCTLSVGRNRLSAEQLRFLFA